MRVIAIFDVLSHWCLAAWPAFEAAQAQAPTELVLAPILNGFPMGAPAEHEAWFYKRGSLAYDMTLHSDWYENELSTTLHANAAVVAASLLGADLPKTTVAVMRAAMEDGVKMGRRDVAVTTVARIAGLDAAALDRSMRSAEAGRRLNAANAELQRIGCTERPSWLMENANGDRVVMQGIWQKEPILSSLTALQSDEQAYARAGAPPA